MDKVQKYNSFNTNTPSSESYRNHTCIVFDKCGKKVKSGELGKKFEPGTL